VLSPGDQACEVGHVGEEDGAALVGDGPELRKVQLPGAGRVAGHQHLVLVLQGEAADLVVVDEAGLFVQGVVDGVDPLTRQAHLRPVGQVPTVTEVSPNLSRLAKSLQ
jgi:hypothetical protein